MKKVLSIVLSVAMLLTLASAMFVMPASAAEDYIELMKPECIVEGTENVTVNEDGTWTIVGNFAMNLSLNYDIEVYQNIFQDLTTNTPVKITLFDQPDNRWIGLYDNWVGPSHFPAGDYKSNDGVFGIYKWNGFEYATGADITAIYFEFDGATADTVMTLRSLYLNNGTLKPLEVNLGELKNTYDTTIDLAVKDASAWSLTDSSKNGGANAVVTADENALYVGTDAPGWPSIYMDYAEGIEVDANATVYADFTIASTGATTIYLFFNGSTANDFTDGQYFAIVTDATAGHYSGYITLSEVLPEACYNEAGNIVLTSVKIFGTDNTAANNASVTVNALDLLYTAPEEPTPVVVPGDLNGSGAIDMRDALKTFQAASNKTTLTEAEALAADYDGNGTVNMRDALAIFQKASGR